MLLETRIFVNLTFTFSVSKTAQLYQCLISISRRSPTELPHRRQLVACGQRLGHQAAQVLAMRCLDDPFNTACVAMPARTP
jgi:hypothetical protein